MAAEDDWIEDVRRWCFDTSMDDAQAPSADATTAADAASLPSSGIDGSPAGGMSAEAVGPMAFMPYARGSGFDRALSRSPRDV